VQTAPKTRSTESRARELITEALAGTPGRLRVLGALAIAVCVAFGIIGYFVVANLNDELDDARRDAEQLVRLQEIRTNLVRADASATNAFLVGGLEPSETRAVYINAIDTAAETLAQAARASGDDSEDLAEVNRSITEYAGLVESARANNRQGYPVGAAYLRAARASLRTEALPQLQQLVDDGIARANASSSAENAERSLWWLLGVVFVVLIGIQVWLFLRTHRIINPPLAVATGIVVVLGLLAIAVVSWSAQSEANAREGPYARTVALATARINAFDAKSEESVTLIARGADAGAEGRYLTAMATAYAALGHSKYNDDADGNFIDIADQESDTVSALEAYDGKHIEVRKLDDSGKYDEAVALATGDGEANRSFTNFADVSETALHDRSEQLSDDLDRASLPLVPLAWLMLVAGAVAAIAANRGIAQRLREYR
jgi:hypothetical protein